MEETDSAEEEEEEADVDDDDDDAKDEAEDDDDNDEGSTEEEEVDEKTLEEEEKSVEPKEEGKAEDKDVVMDEVVGTEKVITKEEEIESFHRATGNGGLLLQILKNLKEPFNLGIFCFGDVEGKLDDIFRRVKNVIDGNICPMCPQDCRMNRRQSSMIARHC